MELSVYGVQTAITDDLSTRYTPYTHTNTQTHTHTNDVDKAGRKKKMEGFVGRLGKSLNTTEEFERIYRFDRCGR